MSRFSIADLEEHKPQATLDNGPYDLEVGPNTRVFYKEETGKASLGVELKVIEGPPQQDGSEPEGRTVFAFFPLTGHENMKDGGDFVKRALNAFITATGIDFDPADFDGDELAADLVGTQVRGINNVRRDQYGEPTEDFGERWKPVS